MVTEKRGFAIDQTTILPELQVGVNARPACRPGDSGRGRDRPVGWRECTPGLPAGGFGAGSAAL